MQTLNGNFDGINGNLIEGWIADNANLDQAYDVDLLVDGNLVGTFKADIFREDLLQAGIGKGCYAFKIFIPSAFCDDLEHWVDLRITGTELSVPNSPKKLKISKLTQNESTYKFHVERINNALLEGWIFDDANPDTIFDLAIFENGNRLATVKADQTIITPPHEQKAGHYFSFILPRALFDKKPHEIEIYIDGTDFKIHDDKIIFDGYSKYEGFLESVDGLIVRGWARESTCSDEIVQLTVCVDDKYAENVSADIFREDLLKAKPGNGFYGFSLKLPDEFNDGKEHKVSVTVAGTDINLKKSPVILKPSSTASITTEHESSEPKYEGHFERVSGHIIFGWMWNAKAPEKAQKVDLYVDNEFITANSAQNFRADLLKAGKGTGKHGFNFEIPERFFDGENHKVEIKVAGTDHSLSGSPKNVLLGTSAVKHSKENEHKSLLADFYALSPKLKHMPKKTKKKATATKMSLISIIVLTRNGAHLIEQLLESFLVFNSYKAFEFIIVDHASEDNTLNLLSHWQKKLPIQVIACDTNHSFSFSNNAAAKTANGEILLFLNNDIIFNQDVLGPMVDILDDPDVGLVGAKLLNVIYHNGKPAYPDVQHLGIQFDINRHANKIAPHDLHLMQESTASLAATVIMPAATGAALMARKEEFLECEGFHEEYFYGFEDVDLGLKYTLQRGQKVISANHLSLLHHRGYSRFNADKSFNQRASGNYEILNDRFGYVIKREYLRSLFEADQTWTAKKLNVAFAVSEASMGATAADYFTAWELGDELRKQYGWNIFYLAKDRDWFDLTDMDVLVVMRDDYNVGNIKNAKPNLMKIAWARNWFPRWGERPWFHHYDMCFCSSQKATDFIRENFNMRTALLRIAGSPERFKASAPVAGFESDYCFTGSFFKHKRDIINALNPDNLPYNFGLFGYDWEQFTKFAKYYRGGIPYGDIPKVYASTKILIDDANHVTKEWGSTNSRVFDAICAGVLVITNCPTSSAEAFEGVLPVYKDRADLEKNIKRYMENPKERTALAKKLHKHVLENHTYAIRAQQFRDGIKDFFCGSYKIAIKIGAPNREVMHEWGDYHYALAMKRSFERQGHFVRIDVLPEWENPRTTFDDVVIVLRGLSTYTPKKGQINLMWNISHTDSVSDREYEGFDHVFVSSLTYAKKLSQRISVPVSPLLQCADPQIFKSCTEKDKQAHDVLFVGNSRKVYRKIIKDAVTNGVKVDIFGSNWETFLPAGYLKGEHIDNRELHQHYAGTKILLNDHWDNMAKYGFLSNRLFDAGACGAFVISDKAEGLEEVFGDAIITYENGADLADKVSYYLGNESKRKKKAKQLQELVLSKHTFDSRITDLLRVIKGLHSNRINKKADVDIVVEAA